MIESERVTVTDVATPLNVARTAVGAVGYSVVATNRDGTNSVDVGGADVTAGGGMELPPGESVSVDVSGNEVMYAIAAATVSARVDVLRMGV